MNNTRKATWLAAFRKRVRPHASKALTLAIGMVIGGAFVGLSSERAQHGKHSDPASPVLGRGSPESALGTCSMHPHIRLPVPGQCPICGMDLIPAISKEGGPARAASQVVLSKRAQALAKLRTAPVRRQADAAAQLRLLGRFEPNETTLKTVTAWTAGRIDELHVNVTGQRVRAGQVIATQYSPEVFSAHQDLLVTKRQIERMQTSPESSRQAANAALAAARDRLRLLGVPEDELARMAQQERPTRAVAIRSPFAGTVIERLATEGAYVSTGTPLYRIANLGSLWLQLDAYENDLSRLSVGQAVRLTVKALPGEPFQGEVTFIEPTLHPQRRTAKVRVQVNNRDGRLRPGMFGEASVATREAKGQRSPLVVPHTAPLFTGRRAIVYLEVPSEDRIAYEARTVRLGPRLGEVYPVVAGLAEGDRVVTKGAFALDADLQIRGGASMMASADDPNAGAGEGAVPLSSTQNKRLAPVVSAYLEVQVALADDDLARATQRAGSLAAAVGQVEIDRPQAAHNAWAELASSLGGSARAVAAAANLEAAREGFEPLSEALIRLLTRFGNPLTHPVRVAFCPMAAGSEGAAWVQEGREVDNSYFGASMLDCGEVRHEVPPAGFLPAPPPDPGSGPAGTAGRRRPR